MAIVNVFKKLMTDEEFIVEAFEIAFGYDSINRGYTKSEVLERLNKLSRDAWMWENSEKQILKEGQEDKIWEDHIDKQDANEKVADLTNEELLKLLNNTAFRKSFKITNKK